MLSCTEGIVIPDPPPQAAIERDGIGVRFFRVGSAIGIDAETAEPAFDNPWYDRSGRYILGS